MIYGAQLGTPELGTGRFSQRAGKLLGGLLGGSWGTASEERATGISPGQAGRSSVLQRSPEALPPVTRAPANPSTLC